MKQAASEEDPTCFDFDYKNKSFKIIDDQCKIVEVEFSHHVKYKILRYLETELEHFESDYSKQNSIEQKIVFINEKI
jgi:hypothetical protein